MIDTPKAEVIRTMRDGYPYAVGAKLDGIGTVISCEKLPDWGYEIRYEIEMPAPTAAELAQKPSGRDTTIQWMREESGYTDYMPRHGYYKRGERPVRRHEVPELKED